jgi:hypothetical protein
MRNAAKTTPWNTFKHPGMLEQTWIPSRFGQHPVVHDVRIRSLTLHYTPLRDLLYLSRVCWLNNVNCSRPLWRGYWVNYVIKEWGILNEYLTRDYYSGFINDRENMVEFPKTRHFIPVIIIPSKVFQKFPSLMVVYHICLPWSRVKGDQPAKFNFNQGTNLWTGQFCSRRQHCGP